MASSPSTVMVPKGFPPEIFGSSTNIKFLCWQCKSVLKNPVQNNCGHRICKDCMTYLLRNNANQVACKSCKDEDPDAGESFLKEEEAFLDKAILREMSSIPVTCTFNGCSWTGTFKEYEAHYENCEFTPVVCVTCGLTVAKSKLTEHNETNHATSGIRLCPFGCGKEVDFANLNAHILEYPAVHFGAVNKRLELLERGVANRQTAPRADENITSKLQDFDVRLKTLESQPQKLQSRMVLDSNTGAAGAAAAVATSGAAAAGATAMFEEAADVSDQLLMYEGVISVLAKEMDRMQTQMKTMDTQRANDRKLIDLLDTKVAAMERAMALKDVTIAELELRMTNLESTSYDGTLLWRITDFTRKRQEAVSGRITSVYSPPFYTSRTGYKMCARLYLNGDGMGKGTHVSLFFVVMRGAYDALLKWPFRQKVTLMFLDQNNREHVVDAFRPDPTSSSFKRPTTEMNIASGCPLLMPLSSLDSSAHAYVKDNTAYIKIAVNCDDLNPV